MKHAPALWAYVRFADLSIHVTHFSRSHTFCGLLLYEVQREIAQPVDHFLGNDPDWFETHVCALCLVGTAVSNFETLRPILKKKLAAAGQVGI